ncbi:hypothetical protein [Paraflavitalea sp. CAU 1676]|uniref:hypothetical protein n=1 Tax=Paraflavitalea sp. CAU 1676 TaxID=3032598 RepID=UPI0023D9B078|nr:hypothetical protein [Paraflavitalea sp. CAU 1676]MDF2188478.1 hypothetical protein [Paraflavitalea sp. CAU 1676]
MGLFNFFKKSADPQPGASLTVHHPYRDQAPNLIYNLLFCDSLELFKANTQPPWNYPFDVLFTETTAPNDLQKILDDTQADPRLKVLAANKLLAAGHQPGKKELFAVIVEVGLDNGLDVLASFVDGTARYINHTGKILIWETRDDATANEITSALFAKSGQIVQQIGPWDKPRRPQPSRGNCRISFLVSDGLYFGEGPLDVLFSEPMASPALNSATQLMQYITQRSLQQQAGQ